MGADLLRHTIRVVVVDDHPTIHRGLEDIFDLAPEIEIVGGTEDGRAALALVGRLRPDILILDLCLGPVDGRAVARQVRGAFPAVKVSTFTVSDDLQTRQEARDIGVHGYLVKTIKPLTIVDAVRAAVPQRTRQEIERARAALANGRGRLTRLQREVLALLMRGYRNAAIAAELCISVKAVEAHVTNLLDRMDAASRGEAVYRARALNLLPPDLPPADGDGPTAH